MLSHYAKKLVFMRHSTRKNLLDLIIISLVVGIIVLLTPVHSSMPRGILLPTSATYPQLKSQQVSIVPIWHSSIEPIGVIHTSIFPGDGDHDNSQVLYQKSIHLAKQIAAQYGANVISVGSVVNYLRAGPLNIYQLIIKVGRQ